MVALVLTASCVALVALQRQVLMDNLDGSIEQRAATIAANLADTGSGGAAHVVADTEEEDRAVQVVAANGEVIGSTANLDGAEVIVPDDAQPEPEGFRTVRSIALQGGDYRVFTREVAAADGDLVIHVAQSTEDVEDAIASLVASLAVSIPVVVVALTLLMWWLTGRALSPVEQIRCEVDSMAGDRIGNRVQVPVRDDEIRRLAVTMNRMLDRLENASERQARFVADAAHELRTPLTRIRTELEVDLAHPSRADPDATNRRVLQEAGELQYLIDDLLFLARSDAEHLVPRRAALDLDDLVLAEIRDQRLEARPVEIDSRRVSASQILGDADQMRRVVRNLLSNAVRHAQRVVKVTLHETSEGIELVVTDDGSGIAPGDAERVFERFTRLDDSRARLAGGTGLGLSIAREIVEAHGGEIMCDTDQPSGARFVVRLPAQV